MHTVSFEARSMFYFTMNQYFSQLTDLVMDMDNTVITTHDLDNVVTPSHRIPPEIVVNIIDRLLPTKIDYGSLIQKRLDVLLRVTSICRYWRYAAFDNATLWSVVPIDRKSLGELFLQRSRNAPLFVTFEVNTRRCCPAHQAMVLLLPHMQRVKKIQFRAPAPVLIEIFSILNVYMSGARLEEISIRVDTVLGDKEGGFILDLLLKHASALKVLRLDVLKCNLPVDQLLRFSQLSHLELLSTHGVHEIPSLFTSLPSLTSIKVRAKAFWPEQFEGLRIVPQANLRHIHLQIKSHTPNIVFGVLRIPTGVHFECEIMEPPLRSPRHPFLPLTTKSFENTSHIEELRVSLPSYSGSGPTGSFSITDYLVDRFQPPIEDFSHLLRLTVGGTIEQWSLEYVVGSAPRLVSVVLVDCVVIRSQADNRISGIPPSPVDADSFVKAISEERLAGADMGDRSDIVVNGILEGGRLEEFRSLLGNRNQVGERDHTLL
ncbi:hypothetical protein BDM02DRAFT_1445659 [Thelephora ganbajun]|uniref:Uncharacterized protein n=1 Tax=Thelephora ganbajun TaxID=370292 RepID=A0ACB6ZKR5_THEGA|nr:hypothetical protein BDM02DRAFT_1445659 [Thelephora ganbajun]